MCKRAFDLVVFDLDGTLIDSSPDIILSAKHVIEKFSLPKREDAFIADCIGGGARALVKKCAGDVSQDLLEAATEEFMRYYQQNCAVKSCLYEGVAETLEKLKDSGVTMAVATMKVRQATLKMLEDYHIDHYFSAVVTMDDVLKGKPDPECIQKILRERNFDQSQAIIVGDSPADINAGVNAGVKTCAVTYGFGAADTLAGLSPDYMIDKFGSLKDIILLRHL